MSVSEPDVQSIPVIIFGEVLYDNFPDGRRVLGGAPFNVGWTLNGFGRRPVFISSVGNDEDGATIKRRMVDWSMSSQALQTDGNHPTGEVNVTIENDEPSYEICLNRAWDFIRDDGYASEQILYHGLLALRSEASRRTLRAIAGRSDAQRFFDINLRPPYVDPVVLKEWIHGVEWLKLNIDELRTILDDPGINFEDYHSPIDRLREEFSVRNVVLTGGRKGAVMRGEYGDAACLPAPRPESIVDTVGAGDAFSAATIEGILRGIGADEIVMTASKFAARVCGLRGATTEDPNFYRTTYHA